MTALRIASRGSPLALVQSRWIAQRLRDLHPTLEVEIVEVKTSGDRDQQSPLHETGGVGLFTREVDQYLLDNRADLAVHSLKDLPTTLVEGLRLAAVPERESTEDVLAGCTEKTLRDLPPGATVATGSLRRRAQLLAARPDLNLVEVRGNVDTRLAKVTEHGWAGTILARAGLDRLGRTEVATLSLAEVMLPAVAQGALGIVCRAADTATSELLAPLNEQVTRARVAAERAVLRELKAGCHAPVGVRTVAAEDGGLSLTAGLFALDGTKQIRVEQNGRLDQATELGCAVAQEMLAQGGEELLAQAE